ncbi:MAG: hypothetical protein R6U66_12135 [Bacteroidales bacterium]|jgi:hypothetical protein
MGQYSTLVYLVDNVDSSTLSETLFEDAEFAAVLEALDDTLIAPSEEVMERLYRVLEEQEL